MLDDGNKPHTVRFSRTKKKIVYIKMKVLTNQFLKMTVLLRSGKVCWSISITWQMGIRYIYPVCMDISMMFMASSMSRSCPYPRMGKLFPWQTLLLRTMRWRDAKQMISKLRWCRERYKKAFRIATGRM